MTDQELNNLNEGDLIYTSFFYAHELHRFTTKCLPFSHIQYSSTSVAYLYSGKNIISSQHNCFLSKKESVKALIGELFEQQDSLKEDYKKERKALYERIEQVKNNWLRQDREINDKIGYLKALEGE